MNRMVTNNILLRAQSRMPLHYPWRPVTAHFQVQYSMVCHSNNFRGPSQFHGHIVKWPSVAFVRPWVFTGTEKKGEEHFLAPLDFQSRHLECIFHSRSLSTHMVSFDVSSLANLMAFHLCLCHNLCFNACAILFAVFPSTLPCIKNLSKIPCSTLMNHYTLQGYMTI